MNSPWDDWAKAIIVWLVAYGPMLFLMALGIFFFLWNFE